MEGGGKRGRKGNERQGRKRREIVKGEEENLKWKGNGMKMSKGPFFFFFFCLSLFETTKTCLRCTKMEISTEKKSGNGKFSNLAHL